jgi:hypothetical protein
MTNRLLRTLLPLLLAIGLAGCRIDSVNPISPIETAEADPAIHGLWVYQAKDEVAYVHIGPEFALKSVRDPDAEKQKRTRIVVVDHKPNGMTDEAYVAHGSRLGKQRFLNVVQLDGGPSGFTFVRYALADRDTLRFSPVDPEQLKAAISAGHIKGTTRGQGLSARAVITADSAEIAAFLRRGAAKRLCPPRTSNPARQGG